MNVLLVSGWFYPAKHYGGPVEVNWRLCQEWARQGLSVRVLTTDANGTDRLPPTCRGWHPYPGFEVFYGRRTRRPDLSLALRREILTQASWANVAYVIGTYNWYMPFAIRVFRRKSIPVVIAPHGSLMTAARANRAWKKRPFDVLFQNGAIRSAAAFHATSKVEAAEIRRLVPQAAVWVVPNGVDVPAKQDIPERSAGTGGMRYILYLGRLHPHKRVDLLLEAFARFRETAGLESPREEPLPELWIAGAGDASYRRELECLSMRLGLPGVLKFLGHVESSTKSGLLAGAEFLVLASRSESFGMVVAEALAHGVPCLTGGALPWAELETEGCGYQVDDSVEGLSRGMIRLWRAGSAQRKRMGEAGRLWMAREFSWAGSASLLRERLESLAATPVHSADPCKMDGQHYRRRRHEAGSGHRHYGARRILSGRAVARQGLRGVGYHSPLLLV